jgi:predicted transglutaminase-like cysteine proteinase
MFIAARPGGVFAALLFVLQIHGALAGAGRTSFTPVGERTAVPYGWADFCGRQPQECSQPPLPAETIQLTRATQRVLSKINKDVNAAIQPVSNLDHWGTLADHWDYPTDGKGDCKIYALQKRRLLIQKGFPRQALLMTIVRDGNGAGHTILSVHTDKGDLILDNLTDEILPWDETGYRFIKRQSQENPNVWLSLLPEGGEREPIRNSLLSLF